MDNDLLSIQQARDLAVAAREAQRQFLRAAQADVDRICAAMAEAAYAAADAASAIAAQMRSTSDWDAWRNWRCASRAATARSRAC